MSTLKTAAQLLAQRPAAEKAISEASAAIQTAGRAKQAALEAGDRKALGSARDDLDEAEFAHAKATRALADLDQAIANAGKTEKRAALHTTLAERDRLLTQLAEATTAEAKALLASVEQRARRRRLATEAAEFQATAQTIAAELGDNVLTKNIDLDPGG